jgi:hypothetical protein
MLSSTEEQDERRRVLANDQRVREQTGTFMSHTHSELGGRFSAATPTHTSSARPLCRSIRRRPRHSNAIRCPSNHLSLSTILLLSFDRRLKQLTRHQMTRHRLLLWRVCSALMSGLFLKLAIHPEQHASSVLLGRQSL